MSERRARPAPLGTLALVAAALVASASPALRAALLLDRSAVLGGQLWRVVSGHLVHSSLALAAFDLGALALLGAWVERRSRGEWLATLALAALLASAAVLALRPDLASYEGASALATAFWVGEGVWLLRRDHEPLVRGAAGCALAALALKLALESAGLWPGFVTGAALEPVPCAHVAGALAGLAVRCGAELRLRRGPQSPETCTVISV